MFNFVFLFRRLVGMSEHTLPAIGLGIVEGLSPLNVPHTLQLLDKLHEELLMLLGEDGVLLYPSHPLPAPYHNQPLLMPFNFSYTGIFNALALPVTQVQIQLFV
jgi:fatty acid amide hydrolase 2